MAEEQAIPPPIQSTPSLGERTELNVSSSHEQMRVQVTSNPSNGRTVLSTRPPLRDGASSTRTGTPGAVEQDLARTKRRWRTEMEGIVVWNRLFDHFVLTYADPPSDWAGVQKDMTAFVRGLRATRKVKAMRVRLAYLFVISASGDSGRPHVHLVMRYGFSVEDLAALWPHGETLHQDEGEDEHALRKLAGYLTKNVIESTPIRPCRTRGYHAPLHSRPPKEIQVYPDLQTAWEALGRNLQPRTTFWASGPTWPWGGAVVRDDHPPDFEYPSRTGQVGLVAGPAWREVDEGPQDHTLVPLEPG